MWDYIAGPTAAFSVTTILPPMVLGRNMQHTLQQQRISVVDAADMLQWQTLAGIPVPIGYRLGII